MKVIKNILKEYLVEIFGEKINMNLEKRKGKEKKKSKKKILHFE